MKIAVLQTPSASLDRLREVARTAADRGARLLITPEMFTTGYNVPGVVEKAQRADGPWLDRVAEIARITGVAILYGFPERDGGEIFNTAQLVDRDGSVLAKHRKSHLFGDLDTTRFTAGAGDLAIVDLDGVRVGILVCYDIEFPEAVRSLALAGADLIAVPTALMRPYEVVARTIVPARAYENQVYVAYANRSGHETELAYCGESCVVGPDGADVARAGSGDQLLLADIDLARLASSRAVNTHLSDRRPRLYGALTETQERPR